MWQVIGHDRTVAQLSQGLSTGHLSHAYLISGPPHIGKATLALDFASALNCTGAHAPCGVCSSCRRIPRGLHPDVHLLGEDILTGSLDTGRTEIGIEEIRELRRQSALKPFEGRRRVFIINGAELLSREAANALLKTLEEPPSDTILILITSDAALTPDTIRSRCQTLALQPLPPAKVTEAVLDRTSLDESQAALVAGLSQGRLGWALRAASDATVLSQRDADLDRVIQLLEAPLDQRFAYAEGLAQQFAKQRSAARQELALLEEWLEDLLRVALGRPDLAVNQPRLDSLFLQASSAPAGAIVDALRLLQDIGSRLEANVNARLALEVLMLELPRLQQPAAAAGPV